MVSVDSGKWIAVIISKERVGAVSHINLVR